MKLTLNFDAPEGTHFGRVKSLDEVVSEIPNLIDAWKVLPSRLVMELDKARSWVGYFNGRLLTAPYDTSRPEVDATGLVMMNKANQTPTGLFVLGGAQINTALELTIACKVKIAAEKLNEDLHYIWGSTTGQINRLEYRIVNGNNYMRFVAGSASTPVDVDLPANHGGEIAAVVVKNSEGDTLYIDGYPPVNRPQVRDITLPNLQVGGITPTQADLPGWYQSFGVWRHAASPSEVQAIMQWMR